MQTFVIGYDLNSPRDPKDYSNLKAAIQSFGTWWHHLDSTWLVRSNMTATQIRDKLIPYFDSGDELLVATLTGEGAWFGLNQKGEKWLLDNL